MAEDLIKLIATQASSILEGYVQDQWNLVVNVREEIDKLITTLGSIQDVVVDAEKREIEVEAIKKWVRNLKLTSYDMEDALTDWSTAIHKVNGETSRSNLSKMICLAIACPCFCFNRIAPLRKVAIKIRNINQRLVSINSEKDAFGFASTHSNPNDEASVVEPQFGSETTSFADQSTIFGRDDDQSTVLSKLISERNPPIIFVWGLGGVGKSTLAQSMFNCTQVQEYFKIKMWVSVGRTFDPTKVAKSIVEEAKGSSPDCRVFQTALRHVSDSVNGQRFLLVLDNVWAEEHNGWEPLFVALKGGAPGSKILITSRKEGVGRNIDAIVGRIDLFSVPSQQNQMGAATFMHHLVELPDEDCWTIFSRFAFSGRGSEFYEDLKVTGRKISDKCRGLPFAAKIVGSLMLSKYTKEEWELVVDDKIWQLEVEERLSRLLLLSYYDLPSAIKRCFCYCANFPKDSKIDTVNLIQIWMAQGYLSSGGSDEMEITGRGYLNSLVTRSLFQDLERDKDDQSVVRFKLHDMVHDVANYLMKNECLMVTGTHSEAEQNQEHWMHFRHLTITREDDATFPIPPNDSERLYTFSVQSFHDCPAIVTQVDCLPPNFFHHFKYLKTLDLSRNMLSVLPDDVEKLTNLRHLNLSHNPLSNLPEKVCSLLNLQTLKLVACRHLTALPQSIGKLIHLRHLEIDQTSSLQSLPKGTGKLTSLRTLSKFVISTEDASCKLGDLKHLNHLRGRLHMEGLGCVADVNEAKEAELEKKEHLVDLHINCSSATSVIEALQLNTNVRALQMDLYEGQRFPSWMVSLTNLKKLRIQEWANCISLPPLGKLPSLEILHIEGLSDLTHVGNEFLGLETDETDIREDGGKIGEASSVSSTIAFRKLKKLKFSHMERWEEWNVMNNIEIMPCLRYLKLSHCNGLQSLPRAVLKLSLKKLRIHGCVLLQQRYQKETGKDREMVSHISKVQIRGR